LENVPVTVTGICVPGVKDTGESSAATLDRFVSGGGEEPNRGDSAVEPSVAIPATTTANVMVQVRGIMRGSLFLHACVAWMV